MLIAEPNIPIRLITVTSDGNAGLFCQATVFDNSGTSLGTLSMPSAGSGMYGAQYTFTSSGKYSVLYKLYTNSGFTIPAAYDQAADQVDVSDFKSGITRILGLLHENTVVDTQTYNVDGFLTSSRIRSYDSKANANLAGSGGLQTTWTMTATYVGANLTNYKIVREP